MASGDEFVEVKVDNRAKVTSQVRAATSKAVRALAFGLETLVKQELTQAGIIDTGALKASVYTQTSEESGREIALAEAARLAAEPGRHSGQPHDFSPADVEWTPTKPVEAKVAVGAAYGQAVEHVHKNGPYFAPAVDQLRARAPGIVEKIYKRELP